GSAPDLIDCHLLPREPARVLQRQPRCLDLVVWDVMLERARERLKAAGDHGDRDLPHLHIATDLRYRLQHPIEQLTREVIDSHGDGTRPITHPWPNGQLLADAYLLR